MTCRTCSVRQSRCTYSVGSQSRPLGERGPAPPPVDLLPVIGRQCLRGVEHRGVPRSAPSDPNHAPHSAMTFSCPSGVVAVPRPPRSANTNFDLGPSKGSRPLGAQASSHGRTGLLRSASRAGLILQRRLDVYAERHREVGPPRPHGGPTMGTHRPTTTRSRRGRRGPGSDRRILSTCYGTGPGQLVGLGRSVTASAVWNLLQDEGLDPARTGRGRPGDSSCPHRPTRSSRSTSPTSTMTVPRDTAESLS